MNDDSYPGVYVETLNEQTGIGLLGRQYVVSLDQDAGTTGAQWDCVVNLKAGARSPCQPSRRAGRFQL